MWLKMRLTPSPRYVLCWLTCPPHLSKKPRATSTPPEAAAADAKAAEKVGYLVPASTRQPYDVVDVVSAIVDHGELVQVQEDFAQNVVVGLACIEGRPVGIVANQPLVDAGTLDVDASEKLARFGAFL